MNKQTNLINMILRNEGGYANDPSDSGGRTYKGISENNFPNWKGWKIINKHEPLKRGEFIKDEDLDEEIFNFYLVHFYYKLKLDQINNLYISAHLLDHGVNAGISNGVKCLQRALNDILSIDIIVDGKIGPVTISEINNSNPKTLLSKLIEEREKYYKSIALCPPLHVPNFSFASDLVYFFPFIVIEFDSASSSFFLLSSSSLAF
jgi:lysozyme family protein